MNPFSIELIAADRCEMLGAKRAVIAEAIAQATAGHCGQPASPAAAITISVHCWRDPQTNKLHCKLSVSFGAA